MPEMVATIHFGLHGIAPLSFSKVKQSSKIENETDEAFEDRTWREHIHENREGQAGVPGIMVKNAMSECAIYFGEKIKGKRGATWTKHFDAGMMIVDFMPIFDDADKPVMAKEMPAERLWLNADGKRGGNKRVWRKYPYMVEWNCEGNIHVFDPIFRGALDKIKDYLRHTGQFIGLGRWRPRNRGMYGRFEVTKFKEA